MGFLGTAVVYLILGGVVAVAVLLRDEQPGLIRRSGTFVMALLFWPFFAPLLLGGTHRHREMSTPNGASNSSSAGSMASSGALGQRVQALQAQLLSGLEGLSDVAESVLAPEVARVRGLTGAVTQMERRLVEMDALLRTAEFDREAALAAVAALTTRNVAESDSRLQSVRARLRNIDRLMAMRTQTAESLERVMLKLEEMSSQLKLLRFANHADGDVVRLLKDLAESVEEVTEGLLAQNAPAPAQPEVA
jgi:hypothetical protein